jgi:sugar phosphate isomerase/epimerase
MSAAPSLQLYSVRRSFDEDPLGTLRRVADVGYETVELAGFAGRAENLSTLLRQSGLRAKSGHAHVLEVGADVDAILRDAELLELEAVIDPALPRAGWQDPATVLDWAARFSSVAELAEGRGVRVGYHNHEWELACLIDGRSALEVFADALDPRVVLEVDTFWAEVGGVSAPELLRRLGDRVRYLHLKDGPLTRDTTSQVPLGRGSVDVPAVLEAAPGAHGIVEFDDYDGDMFDAVSASLEYLRGAAR